MKLSSTLLAASLGLAFAHGDHNSQHLPKILGGRKFLSELGARRKQASHENLIPRKHVTPAKRQGSLEKRQDDENTDGRCGPGIGACATGYCCSAEGWCGLGIDYCSAPDCQMNYATGCDANKKPSGPDTSQVARPQLGDIPYGGGGIYDCVNAGEIALTFDDGPYLYTSDLLDKLQSYGAKATFFITGINLGKGAINDPSTPYPDIIKRMHAEGHQIGSHTWSHQNASQLTNAQFTDQIIWNEIAINSILGFFPTYMRPPYSICERNCQDILATLGYHVTYFNLDTEGYLHDSPTQIQTSKNIWDDVIDDSDPETDSFLQIEHDIHPQIVYNLTDYILTSLFSSGYRAVTVGECLGDPSSNWYRAGPAGGDIPTPSDTTTTIPTRTTIPVGPTSGTGPSTDGTCGNGVTCEGTRWGRCCSAFGYCGVGNDFCSLDAGCQVEWGSCDGVESPVTSAVPTTTATPTTRPTTPPPSTSTSTTSTSAAPTQTGLATSRDGRCGEEVQETCTGSRFGNCCSASGRCTSSVISCLAILGCQPQYGRCL